MMSLWPADEAERVFKAVADFSRQIPEPVGPPPKRSKLTPKERHARIERNKVARKARRKTRGKR